MNDDEMILRSLEGLTIIGVEAVGGACDLEWFVLKLSDGRRVSFGGRSSRAHVPDDRAGRDAHAGPVRSRAPSRANEDRAYRELRAELLPGPCDVCAPLIAAGRELNQPVQLQCAGTAHELHHRRKRSSSGALAHRDNVVRSCHDGNMAVEQYPVQARRAGLVVREGDPEWDALSARAWRKAQL